MSTILTANDIRVRYNDRVVLDHVSLTIGEQDRLGMVGRNGAGKSTFLKILAGLVTPDAGEITRRRELVIGYLPQDSTLDPGLTVAENIRTGARHVLDLIREFESLPATSGRHNDLEHRIQALDGWGLDHRIETAMGHLNCPDGARDIRSLSGGEQRRVALCRAIISRPDLLILDEPTNHLDTDSIEWVGEFLETYPGAFLMVTHDRHFLDRITNRMLELAQGALFAYEGNYTDYLITKASRDAATESLEHKRQMFLRRELDWVRRGPSARRTKSKSRLEQYHAVAGEAAPELDGDVDLVIPPPPPLGNRAVELVNVGMTLGGRRLFSKLNLTFSGGQRLGITGRNGLGKTTLLKILQGQLDPTEGSVKTGPLIRFNYIDQQRLFLDEERTVLEEVSDGTEFVLFGEHKLSLRSYLKRFLFTDERIVAQVKHLSGGERSRLLLARILKQGGNFLILDEPTNDLDLPTLRVLEEALMTFAGVVVAVSHDRYFLNRICTDLLAFEGDGCVVHSVGNYDYHLEKRARNASLAPAPAERTPTPTSTPDPAAPSRQASPGRPRRLSFKETRELEGMEARILAAETEVARIEGLYLEPDFHRKYGQQTEALTAELTAQKAEAARLYERWQELEAIRAGAPGADSPAG